MSKRTNIGRRMDEQRLSELVQRPGVDPRLWVSLCVVLKVVIDDDGVFADVAIMSTATVGEDGEIVAQTETVRVAANYAGNGFGLWFPPLVDDQVVVHWPDGNPDHGGILTERLWSTADPPPSAMKDNPDDALLMIKKDVNLRIVTQGSGNVVLKVADGKVLLGDEDGTKPVARKDDKVNLGTWTAGFGAGPLATCIIKLTVVSPDGVSTEFVLATPGPFELEGKIKEGSSHVESD